MKISPKNTRGGMFMMADGQLVEAWCRRIFYQYVPSYAEKSRFASPSEFRWRNAKLQEKTELKAEESKGRYWKVHPFGRGLCFGNGLWRLSRRSAQVLQWKRTNNSRSGAMACSGWPTVPRRCSWKVPPVLSGIEQWSSLRSVTFSNKISWS